MEAGAEHTSRSGEPARGKNTLASRGRLLLAGYLDYLLFCTCWSLFLHFADVPPPGSVARLGVFFLIEAVAAARFGSPGARLLSIYSRTVGWEEDGRETPFLKVPLMPRDLAERENRITLLLGTLFILEGSKSLVRWTHGAAAITALQPVLGPRDFVLAAVGWGVLNLYAGYAFFRLKPFAPWLGAGLVTGMIAVIANGWERVWPGLLALLVQRREARGQGVSPETAAWLHDWMPIVFAGFAIVVLALILASANRFQPPDKTGVLSEEG